MLAATKNKGKALITGASSGIGAVYAHRLAPVSARRSEFNQYKKHN
jgi:short-subunit dehydrogenase